MKKAIPFVLALAMLLALAACGGSQTPSAPSGASNTPAATEAPAPTEAPVETEAPAPAEAPADTSGPVMDHAAYIAAEIDDPVVVETYVQAHQSWWDGKVTVYAQSEDGAYFIYNMGASEEEAAALVPGAHIRVTGYKGEWSGEVEIVDATFELLDGSYIAPAEDVTALLGSDELIDHQNEFVSFKGMTVEPANDDGAVFLYNWDGSGEEGNDLYFNVSLDGTTYTFTVESYLCGAGTEVYEAVKALSVGDVIDLEGFLYWYEGANPHITAVKPAV